jgi:hypothetical protein
MPSPSIHLEPDSPRRAGEQRRYFPDWECRLREVCEEIEADHNSYLAGGYAEEFGYGTQSGASRGVPLLDGKSPEESAAWRCQAAAMHPGYPIRPYPIVPEDEPRAPRVDSAARSLHTEMSNDGVRVTVHEVTYHGRFVPVADRAYERDRRRATQRATALLTRFAAALFALRWGFPRRRW